MISLVKLSLRLIWLALFVLGVRKAAELIQIGTEGLAHQIEDGEETGVNKTIVRLHNALHHRRSERSDGED